MTLTGVRLGVDIGAAHTVAALWWPDGRAAPLLFDGSPLLRSGVFADPHGMLLTGSDAAHAGRTTPERYEPYPILRIDAGAVRLGTADIAVTAVLAAVLHRVATEAGRVAGGPITHTTLTYPASWGQPRRDTLYAAAASVFGTVELVPEPLAVAQQLGQPGPLGELGTRVPVGGCAAVCDLGASGFGVTLVQRETGGFTVLAADGLDGTGGLYLDAAVMTHLGKRLAARDPATWQRLAAPASPADQRASRQLWEDVRTGREMLSRTGATTIHIPLFDEDVVLDQAQLDQVAGPLIDRTVATTHATLYAAGVPPTQLAGVFLIGGASRQPLVASHLHRALGVAPVVVDQPELAPVAGSLHHPAAPAGSGRRPGRLAALIAAGGAVALVAVIAAAVAFASLGRDAGGDDPDPAAGAGGGSPSAAASARPAPAPGPTVAPTLTPAPTPEVPSVADPCLVGSWELTSIVRDHNVDGVTVRTSSEGGAVYYYRPDGTFLVDLDQGWREVGTAEGREYEIVGTGTITGSYRTSGDLLLWSNTNAEGELIVRVDGDLRLRVPTRAISEQGRYVCADETLHVYYETAGAFEYERTSREWDD